MNGDLSIYEEERKEEREKERKRERNLIITKVLGVERASGLAR